MKAVAIVGAGGIARRGNGHALVRHGRTAAGELGDDPAIGQVIVEHDRVAGAAGLANPAKTSPE